MALNIAVELSLTCPHCRQPVHLEGALERARCGSCQQTTDLPAEWWNDGVATALEFATDLEPGETRTYDETAPVEMHLWVGRVEPTCSGCNAELPPLSAEDLDGEVFCPACGKGVSARVAPDWLRDAIPLIGGLVGERATADAAAQPGGSAIVIHCMSCGASLPVDGSTRTVNCTYCSNDNFLPDPLWLRLHPAATVCRWFALLDANPEHGVLPPTSSEFFGVATDDKGELVVAWGGMTDACVAAVAPSGALRWKAQIPAVIFEDRYRNRHPGLTSTHDGHGVMAYSPEGNSAVVVDTRMEAPLFRLRADKGTRDHAGADGLPPFLLAECRSVALDTDLSLIVLREFGHGDAMLARFKLDKTPLPMWPEGAAPPAGRASWRDMPARVLVPPDDVLMTVGRDGRLYLVDKKLRHVAAYERDGSVAEVRELAPPPKTADAEAVAVDASGTLFALAEVEGLPNILRAPAGGPLAPWAGYAAGTGTSLGSYAHYLAVAHDGRVYVAASFDSLRAFDASGKQIWRSPSTRRFEERRRRGR